MKFCYYIKRAPNKTESDQGKDFLNSFYHNFSEVNNEHHFLHFSAAGLSKLKDLVELQRSYWGNHFLNKETLIIQMNYAVSLKTTR